MADDPPISTTVQETVTVDTGADKEQLGNLNEDFKDFWAEQDSKTDLEKEPAGAPAAPGTGAAQETSAKSIDSKPPEVKPGEFEKPKASYSDEEIGKMELPPNARPELQEHFKKIKELWINDRAQAKAESERVKALETQLAEARQNSLSPEMKADYEHAVSVRRRFDFVSDPEFVKEFHAPVYRQYEKILEETFQGLPDKQAARAWVDHMKQNYRPEQLNEDYWLAKVIHKIPNELARERVKGSVNELIKLQENRQEEISRRTQDKDSFDSWQTERTQKTAEKIQSDIMAEIGVQEKRIKEVLPVDVNTAKTPEERVAMEAHNERFTKLNKFFTDTVQDLSKNGPRAWVRAAVEATRTQIMNDQIINLEKELKDIKAERDQFKAELDKITGARRRLINTTGTPTGAQKKEAPSLKQGLDLNNSFKNFWDEQDRTT